MYETRALQRRQFDTCHAHCIYVPDLPAMSFDQFLHVILRLMRLVVLFVELGHALDNLLAGRAAVVFDVLGQQFDHARGSAVGVRGGRNFDRQFNQWRGLELVFGQLGFDFQCLN